MAMPKFAAAQVEQKSVQARDWNAIRESSSNSSAFQKSASKNIDLSKYNPEDYLLSHCTIIASVEVDEVPNVKTGQQVEDGGRTIKRPYNDYFITPDTAKYVNQNGDAWERDLLLSTYDSFIGAENYVEHVQVPELSKGKVVDAVARDLGDTVYIDILVATNRKHSSLVQDIENGKVNKLSMGCSISYSICTKCGNVAADECDLCQHVKYMKGNTFTDSDGNERVIAELCGHRDDPDSVKFIEASWVVDPAFDGAVLRKTLEEEEKRSYENSSGDSLAQQIENAHQISLSHRESAPGSSMDSFLKSANYHGSSADSIRELTSKFKNAVDRGLGKRAWGDDDGGDDDDSGGDDDPIDKAVDEVEEYVGEEVSDRLKDKVDNGDEGPEPEWDGPPQPENVNDNILQAYNQFYEKYSSQFPNKEKIVPVFRALHRANKHGWDSVKKANNISNNDIVAAMYIRDRDYRNQVLSQDMYDCLKKVGGSSNYKNVQAFLNTCRLALNRDLSRGEKKLLIRRAKKLK
jgi:hypothetical protein